MTGRAAGWGAAYIALLQRRPHLTGLRCAAATLLCDLLKADQRDDAEAVQAAVLALCHVGYQTLTAACGDVTRDVMVRLPDAALHALVTHGFVGLQEKHNHAAVATAVENLIAAWDQAAARWDLSAAWPHHREA
jgi:hypothetical protein